MKRPQDYKLPMFERLKNIPVFAHFIAHLDTTNRQTPTIRKWNLDAKALLFAALQQ